MKNIFIKILIITLIIGALLGITIILLDIWNNTTEKILETTAVIFGYSIPGLCCSTIREKKRTKTFSDIGIGFCILSCIYFILLIWEIIPFTNAYNYIQEKTSMTLFIIGLSLIHVSLLLRIESKNKLINYSKIATIVLSVIMDILVILVINDIEVSWKIAAVIGILMALGTIVTPILHKIKEK